MAMPKIFITSQIADNTVTMTAKNSDDQVITQSSSRISNNQDVTGASLTALNRIMSQIATGNNVKLVNFDRSFVNALTREYRVWRKFNWTIRGADVKNKKLWNEWNSLRRNNKIYAENDPLPIVKK